MKEVRKGRGKVERSRDGFRGRGTEEEEEGATVGKEERRGRWSGRDRAEENEECRGRGKAGDRSGSTATCR